MTVRERLEQEEYLLLSPLAQKATEPKVRAYQESETYVRTCNPRADTRKPSPA